MRNQHKPQTGLGLGTSIEMAETLQKAVEGLHIRGQREVEGIDEILSEPRLRTKRSQKTLEEVKKELTEEFLTPPTSFSQEWLNKLQQ